MFLISRGNEALTDVTENETAENPRLLKKFQNGVGISKNTNFDERFLLRYEHSPQNISWIT